jgi:cation:H+ antiporter
VQWLAPLASEAPEFIVAALLCLQGSGRGAMAALISSKVNQWTLLVGMIPLAVCVAAGGAWALPLDGRQQEELLLTAAQSLFAIAMLAGRQLSVWGALALAGLFVGQMLIPGESQRIVLSRIYVALAVGLLCVRRDNAARLWRGMVAHVRL